MQLINTLIIHSWSRTDTIYIFEPILVSQTDGSNIKVFNKAADYIIPQNLTAIPTLGKKHICRFRYQMIGDWFWDQRAARCRHATRSRWAARSRGTPQPPASGPVSTEMAREAAASAMSAYRSDTPQISTVKEAGRQHRPSSGIHGRLETALPSRGRYYGRSDMPQMAGFGWDLRYLRCGRAGVKRAARGMYRSREPRALSKTAGDDATLPVASGRHWSCIICTWAMQDGNTFT